MLTTQWVHVTLTAVSNSLGKEATIGSTLKDFMYTKPSLKQHEDPLAYTHTHHPSTACMHSNLLDPGVVQAEHTHTQHTHTHTHMKRHSKSIGWIGAKTQAGHVLHPCKVLWMHNGHYHTSCPGLLYTTKDHCTCLFYAVQHINNKHGTNLAKIPCTWKHWQRADSRRAWHPPFISGQCDKKNWCSRSRSPTNACSMLSANDSELQWLYTHVHPRDNKVGECPHAY